MINLSKLTRTVESRFRAGRTEALQFSPHGEHRRLQLLAVALAVRTAGHGFQMEPRKTVLSALTFLPSTMSI
jgi:hypothetical protein